jgi:hypothetical protein
VSRRQTSTATALRLLNCADYLDNPGNTYDDEKSYLEDQESVRILRKAAKIVDEIADESGEFFDPDTCLESEDEEG